MPNKNNILLGMLYVSASDKEEKYFLVVQSYSKAWSKGICYTFCHIEFGVDSISESLSVFFTDQNEISFLPLFTFQELMINIINHQDANIRSLIKQHESE